MSLTFKDVAVLWKEDKRRYVKKSTYSIYVQLLNRYIFPFFSAVDAPSEENIQELVNKLLASGLSLKTVKDALLVLKMVIRYGSKVKAWPHLEYYVHFPSTIEIKKRVHVLSKNDQLRLLQYIQENFSFKNLGIQICMNTGLRIGEICALQWKDIDTSTGVIHIGKTVQRIYLADGAYRENFLSIDTPKSSSSIRDIPLSRAMLSILKPLTKLMQPDYYIISNSSKPYEPRYYRNYYHKLLNVLNISPVRFHALRHSFATRCIEGKCDYKTVSAILGHASISTTMDLYVHPGLLEKKSAIEKMAKCLGVK